VSSASPGAAIAKAIAARGSAAACDNASASVVHRIYLAAMIDVRLAVPEDLPGILRLQRENLPEALGAEEKAQQGFVSARHTLPILQQMHALAPSVVATSGGELAGYALMMPLECRELVPMLDPMFASLEKVLAGKRFYVMGQVCVAKPFRGQGVFDALYRGHAREYGAKYDCIATEIALSNTRSIRAHQRVGFVEVARQDDHAGHWSLVAWDFGAR